MKVPDQYFWIAFYYGAKLNRILVLLLVDGVVAYDMPQGERRGNEVDLFDFTYDGTVEGGQLAGGLGQLTDGEEGQSNFRLDPSALGTKGYEWVGWKNETFGASRRPLEITFRFEGVRNFTSMRVHVNNMYSKDVRVFSSVRVLFDDAAGAADARPPAVEYMYMRDTLMEYARSVTIPLNNNVGSRVRVQLFFDSKWLMISEVQFESGETSVYMLQVGCFYNVM